MNAAYQSVRGTPGITLNETHLYVRFRPSNIEQIKRLDNTGVELFDYPLDRKIIELGNYYQDPSIPLEDISWLYAVVSPGFSFPSGIGYEILSRLYLPSESEQDIENEAFKRLGYSPEIDEFAGKTTAGPRQPEGFIRVADTRLGNVPVRRVKVRSVRWFNVGVDYTDDNGYFFINNGYPNNRTVSISIHFEDDLNRSKIRTIRTWQVWNIFNVNRIEAGQFINDGLENVNFVVSNDPNNAFSDQKKDWMAASVHNNVQEYFEYCANQGILQPDNNLNIWLTTQVTQAASAPMLHHNGYATNFVAAIAGRFLLSVSSPAYLSVLALVQQYAPDLTYDYADPNNGNPNSVRCAETMFHELSHAVHYRQVGNQYWYDYISYIILNNGYGSPANNDFGRIAISEAWAEFAGQSCTQDKYGIISLPGGYTSHLNRLEWFDPTPTPSNTASAFVTNFPWIPSGCLLDMQDNVNAADGQIGVTDNVQGFTLAQVFSGMAPNVISPQNYRTQIQNTIGVQGPQMQALFQSYGY